MKKSTFIILLILVFSSIFFLWHLADNPAGFFCDEALRGVDAYSLIKNGKDSNNEFLPLFFKGFNNDGVSPFNVYPVIPFIILFGLNEFAVRLVPVFFGLICLLLYYFFLKEIVPEKFSLLGTLLLSTTPWYFHTFRNNMGDMYIWICLTVLVLLFLVKGLKNNKNSNYLYSAIFLGLSMYTYLPSRFITILFFTGIISLLVLTRKFKQIFFMLIIFLIISIPFINFLLTNPASFQRFKDTVGTDLKKTSMVTFLKNYDWTRFRLKYLKHFSDDFLFTKGDADFPGQFMKRHSITGLGLFYPYQKWLMIIGFTGLCFMVIYKKKFELLPVIILLVIFPVADSLTLDNTPFATRSSVGIIPLALLTAFGIFYISQLLKIVHIRQKEIIRIPLIMVLSYLIINSLAVLIVKFSQYPLTASDFWGWQFGARDIVSYFKANKDNYNQLIMEPKFNAPDIFFKFYAPDNCQKCLIGDLGRYNPSDKQLFALSEEYITEKKLKNYRTKKIINYPSGKVAFRIIEVK